MDSARCTAAASNVINAPGGFAEPSTDSPSRIAAASKRQIVARMLVNLAGIYGRNGDLPRSLDVLERLAILEPSNPRIARDLASLRERVVGLN